MIPLFIQLASFGLLWGLKQLGADWPFLGRAGAISIGIMFVFTGIFHFIRVEPMAEMFPAGFPLRYSLVYASGVFEIAAGALLVAGIGPTRMIGYALIAFLLTALPLNVYSAINGVGLGANGPAYLWFRIPLQGFWMWWLWLFAIKG